MSCCCSDETVTVKLLIVVVVTLTCGRERSGLLNEMSFL